MMRSCGAVALGRFTTPGARVTGRTRALRTKADAQQVAFVSQNVPDVRANRGVVAPVAPSAAHALASPGRFERVQRLSTHECTPPDGSEEQEQVGGQVREFAVARFVHPPASADLLIIDSSLGVILRELCSRRFQFINLAAGTRLVPIEATGVDE